MTANALVSVVLPAYNAERYLRQCLDSVFAQTYRPIEIIAVDDGSTDESPRIIRSYSAVNYMRQDNRGPSAARNAGICAAKGKYIAFLDADDVWVPEKLAEQVPLLESNRGAGLVFADMRLVERDGDPQPSMFQKYRLTREFFGDDRCVTNPASKLVWMNFIPTSSVVVRKEAVLGAGGFDETFRKAEDWDCWLRIALEWPIVYSPHVLMLKRVHEVNASRDAEGMNVAALQVLEKFSRNGQAKLTRLGIDMKTVLRDGYRNLGYFYLRQASVVKARAALWRGLSLGFQMRVFVYWLSTFLGPAVVASVVRARG